MTALKPTEFYYKAESGEEMRFKANTAVDADGRFSINYPDELAETASALWLKRNSADVRKAPVRMEQTRGRRYVTGDVLAQCIGFINDVIKEHMACEVIRETVILYGTDIKVAYVKDASGNFHPNGYEAGHHTHNRGETKWYGTLNGSMNQAEHYSIGLVARAFTKITYRRPNSQKIEFAAIHSGAGRADSYLGRLNEFTGLARIEPNRLKEMPYSEEAARFFYETMLGLCMLADRLASFFGDAAAVQAAIQHHSNVLSLPAPPATPDPSASDPSASDPSAIPRPRRFVR